MQSDLLVPAQNICFNESLVFAKMRIISNRSSLKEEKKKNKQQMKEKKCEDKRWENLIKKAKISKVGETWIF